MNKRFKTWVKDVIISCVNTPFIYNAIKQFHKSKVIFLMYHGVSEDEEDYQAWTLIKRTSFQQQVEFLKQNFDCITIDEALDRSGSNQKRPGVVVTFDDGYRNNLEIALPVLERFKVPASVYISTQHVIERRLFWPDVIWIAAKRSGVSKIDLSHINNSFGIYPINKAGDPLQGKGWEILENVKMLNPKRQELIVQAIVDAFKNAQGSTEFEIENESSVFTPLTPEQVGVFSSHPLITVGAHSHCHNLLDKIPLEQAGVSIEKSKKILERLTDSAVHHFAYPNGNFNQDIVNIVKAKGFKSAVSVQPGFFRQNNYHYSINRFGIGANTSIDLFKALLTGIFALTN